MQKLFDLTFVIGIFFSIVGVLLLGYSLLSSENELNMHRVNLGCGIIFCLFGIVMILLAMRNNRVASKENIEEKI